MKEIFVNLQYCQMSSIFNESTTKFSGSYFPDFFVHVLLYILCIHLLLCTHEFQLFYFIFNCMSVFSMNSESDQDIEGYSLQKKKFFCYYLKFYLMFFFWKCMSFNSGNNAKVSKWSYCKNTSERGNDCISVELRSWIGDGSQSTFANK